MDAVGAPDLGRVLEFPGAPFEDLGEALEVLGSVDHIIGGQPVMKPAGMGADDLSHRSGKGDDVVAHLGLDLLDAFEAKAGTLADRLGCLLWDEASLGQGLRGRYFYRQPGLEAVFLAPDAPHVRTGIAADHEASLRFLRSE